MHVSTCAHIALGTKRQAFLCLTCKIKLHYPQRCLYRLPPVPAPLSIIRGKSGMSYSSEREGGNFENEKPVQSFLLFNSVELTAILWNR